MSHITMMNTNEKHSWEGERAVAENGLSYHRNNILT